VTNYRVCCTLHPPTLLGAYSPTNQGIYNTYPQQTYSFDQVFDPSPVIHNTKSPSSSIILRISIPGSIQSPIKARADVRILKAYCGIITPTAKSLTTPTLAIIHFVFSTSVVFNRRISGHLTTGVTRLSVYHRVAIHKSNGVLIATKLL
jgi:hypothetical protein